MANPLKMIRNTLNKITHYRISWIWLEKSPKAGRNLQIIPSPKSTDPPGVRAALTAPGGEADPAPGLETLRAAAPGAGGPRGPGRPGGGGQDH